MGEYAVEERPPGMPGDPDDIDFERSDGEREAAAHGVPVDESAEVDFFGTDVRHTFYLPGTNRRQWFQFRELREGELKSYQQQVSRDVVLQRASGDAKMRIDPASDRQALIRAAVTGWQLFRKAEAGGKGVGKGDMIPVAFNTAELSEVFRVFPAKIIGDLEDAIRKANPMLVNDMTVAEIDEAIEALQITRAEVVAREGKDNS